MDNFILVGLALLGIVVTAMGRTLLWAADVRVSYNRYLDTVTGGLLTTAGLLLLVAVALEKLGG